MWLMVIIYILIEMTFWRFFKKEIASFKNVSITRCLNSNITHSLNIETGRYYNIDRHARICNMCKNNNIEDEYHFISECSKYMEIR
jgi:hypothetical protein